MDVKHITDDFAVAGQITPDDLPVLSAMGFRGVICNRPDGEATDQPQFEEIEAAAKNAGIKVRNVPIKHGMMGPDEVEAFRAAMEELPHPVLAYCRSGARSTTIYEAAMNRQK